MKKIKKIINKKNKSKIVCLTAYSKNIAEEVDKYVDIVLVGDSLGSVLYNYSTTRKVTLTEMINHSKSVRLGVCLLYTSPSPRDLSTSRMPSSA